MILVNKVVLITGSSQGIGRSIAYAFSKRGHQVIITYNSNKSKAEETKKQCLALGAPSVDVYHLDVTDDKNIASVIKAVSSKYTKIDVLINNAGVLTFNPLTKQSMKEIELQLRTNLEGLIKMTRVALPWVRETIVNVASQAGKSTLIDASVYCATKWGVRGFTQVLALENRHLRIYSLNPGLTATSMTDFEGVHPDKVAEVLMNVLAGKIRVDSGGDIDAFKLV